MNILKQSQIIVIRAMPKIVTRMEEICLFIQKRGISICKFAIQISFMRE